MNQKPMPSQLRSIVERFNKWSDADLLKRSQQNQVKDPLYHYTDAAGLKSIVENQQVWFTSHKHLNDPSEMKYGMSIAFDLLHEIGQASDPRIKIFCDMVNDLFTHENICSAFEIFIASFSRERDDLGQWRAYGDNGRGFALGLAAKLFEEENKTDRMPHENIFVTPVIYGRDAARHHHMPAIETAVQLVASAVEQFAELMQDRNVGMQFLDEIAKTLIASQMILNSLTVKHEAYKHENEVRLFIIGESKNLMPHISTRARRGEVVPFIKSDMPIQKKGSIAEIVVGPSAGSGAEDGVRALMQLFQAEPNVIVNRSEIPFRAQSA